MTTVKLTHAGGTLDLDCDAGLLLAAMSVNDPAYLIVHDDQSRTVINTRNLVAIAYIPDDSLPPVEIAPQDEVEADTRTKAELTEALDAAGIEYDKGALKADLQQLAADHKV